MTNDEIVAADKESPNFVFVRVTASDYSYEGWIVAAGWKKRTGKMGVVVEDVTGRWFLQTPEQLEMINAP